MICSSAPVAVSENIFFEKIQKNNCLLLDNGC